jgi:hypothetical protein
MPHADKDTKAGAARNPKEFRIQETVVRIILKT